MAQCPNCGAPAESWATVCEDCGATLDDNRSGQRSGQQGQGNQPRQGQGNQSRQGQGGQQARGGQRRSRQSQGRRQGQGRQQSRQQGGSGQGYGHQKSRNVGGQGQQQASAQGDGGVDRRTVLAGVGGVAVLGGGGYLGYQRFLADGSNSGPKSTARELIRAIEDQDAETVQSLAHPESPQDFSMGGSTTTSITINELREVDPATDRASTAVEADMTVTAEGDTQSVTYRVELLQHDGEWRVWRAGIDSMIERFAGSTAATPTPSGPRAPRASFSFDFDLTDEANSAGFLTISHTSGEAIDYETLSVRGNGFTTPENTGEYDTSSETTIVGDSAVDWPAAAASADGMVQAGNTISVGVTTAYDVRVVWDPQDADTAGTLGEAAGPDA